MSEIHYSPRNSQSDVSEDLLATIRSENLKVYRASVQRLREDVGQESQIAQDYRGRLIYELLQNADDAMSSVASESANIAFVLDDNDLWVANSGRPLDEADVRGLCGISASSKGESGSRRASIGHKGMGFKSVLEITDAPEVYSTTISFRFGPADSVRAVKPLIDEGFIDKITRAPVTRFPWPVHGEPEPWRKLRADGMRTVFRFPLLAKMTREQRDGLATSLRQLPVTSLVFLKHLGSVKVEIWNSALLHESTWTVRRERVTDAGSEPAPEFSGQGTYRVVLTPDNGVADTFLLAYEPEIQIENHRGGLGDISWEGVNVTEVSIAARMRDGHPIALEPEWRKLHVFLPTGEACPYDLLISGAFNSNLSRQEIRVESEASNYNRFLLQQIARTLRDTLIPRLLSGGSSVKAVMHLLYRRTSVGAPSPTIAAQALYEEVCSALANFPLIPSEDDGPLAIQSCALPPLVPDVEVGQAFRRLLPERASVGTRVFPAAEFCGVDTACVLADHGAYCLSPEEAATMLACSDPSRSTLYASGKVFVDPVLRVLERLWLGLAAAERDRLAEAVRREPLFPVGLADNDTARRISTTGLACFYPPRSLRGEVPLDRLCFLMQEICWGDMTPKERNQGLKQELVIWQALFDVQEFKFPDVMRASVLPALDLDRDLEARRERETLHAMERIAAICQLAGRTSNPSAPLPYERLSTNRALFNLSRLDVPCRGTIPDKVEWVPAYKAYFGQDWIGDNSVECILETADEIGIKDLPGVHFLVTPTAFSGLLKKYRYLSAASQSEDGDIGADEVSVDEDEEAALEVDDQSRWLGFFEWLGVNQSLRPVHFHDVEDRASGWLKTSNLVRPEGWIFQKVPVDFWSSYVDRVRHSLAEHSDQQSTVPYFYRLHDLEHLVAILGAASSDKSAKLGRALYEHLARNWGVLEPFSRAQIAQVPIGQVPSMRNKPARAKPEELVEVIPDFWMARLEQSPFCPTGLGPRHARQVWLPTLEVERRFGRRAKSGSFLVPTLEVDPEVLKGKARGFAQALGMRDELTPANFSLEDARLLLQRLRDLYSSQFDAGGDMSQDLREVLRPTYRNLFELLASRERQSELITQPGNALADAPLLATDGAGHYRFFEAKQVFYADRRDTRERIQSDQPIWIFVIDAFQVARSSLTHYFGVRVLEESLAWSPLPGDPALENGDLELLRSGLNEVAPYILARIAADRSDERLARKDARRLRRLFERLEPVTALELGCELEGRKLDLGRFARDAFVRFATDGEPDQVFIVWGERPWPPDTSEAEALASTLCEVFGSGYFEPFLALVQAKTADMYERLLRRAGAPLDIEERRALFLASDSDVDDYILSTEAQEDLKTVLSPTPIEQPAVFPGGDHQQLPKEDFRRVPLYSVEQLLVEGEPILVRGENSPPTKKERKSDGGGRAEDKHSIHGDTGGYGGRTDLDLLNDIGMSVALAFERKRLRGSGLHSAEIFDPSVGSTQPNLLVFDTSTPDKIAQARAASLEFDSAMNKLHSEFSISLEWPGFDVLTLDPRLPDLLDRLIELKSSGVASRIQEMTWNEWKTAASSTLRGRFYLYLVGNLRSDLNGSTPYIRTIKNPFEQLTAEIQVNRAVSRKVQLAVHLFKEAEHLDLSVCLNH